MARPELSSGSLLQEEPRPLRVPCAPEFNQSGIGKRDLQRKTASEIATVEDASKLLGHANKQITQKVYRRVGEVVGPTRLGWGCGNRFRNLLDDG